MNRLALLPLLLLPSALAAQDTIPAFPEARGWGAPALNECRALPLVVHKVTNTNDTGAGSFIAAMNAASASNYDVIVFTTGGRIHWDATTGSQDQDAANFSCVYIAGQTAPGGGITVTGNQLTIRTVTNNVVMRYMTWRKHRRLNIDAKLAIGDHISCAWSGSDNSGGADCLSFGQGDSTVTAEYRSTSSHNLVFDPHENHPTVMPVRACAGTVYRNVLAGPGHRMPLVTTCDTLNSTGGVRVVNNVVYNWRTGSGASATQDHGVVDFLNNYSKRGPGTNELLGGGSAYLLFPFQWRALCNQFGVGNCDLSTRLAGNRNFENGFDAATPPDSAWAGTFQQYVCHAGEGDFTPDCTGDGDTVPTVYRRDAALPLPTNWAYVESPITDGLFDEILAEAGNYRGLTCSGTWVERRDSMDAAAIQNVVDGTGRTDPVDFVGTGIPGASPDPDEPGWVVPTPAFGTSCSDTDDDGLPNTWELNVSGSTTGVTADSVSVSGYLMIEHYLNGSNPDSPTPWQPATFGNDRYVYLLPVDTVPFGTDNLIVPDTTVIPRNANKVSIYNPAQDSVLTVTCQSYGASADSVTVDVRSRAWDRQGMRSAAEIRNRPLSALSC